MAMTHDSGKHGTYGNDIWNSSVFHVAFKNFPVFASVNVCVQACVYICVCVLYSNIAWGKYKYIATHHVLFYVLLLLPVLFLWFFCLFYVSVIIAFVHCFVVIAV